jgi:hypothetical protein
MEYDKSDDCVYIKDEHIFSKLHSIFHLNYRDIQLITNIWLEETYKLEGVTVQPG